MTIHVTGLDHLVLTVNDIQASLDFYHGLLGLEIITFGDNRKALRLGQQKINLHQAGQLHPPVARHPTPGSADLCLLIQTPLADVINELHLRGLAIVEGPVERTGAHGPLLSLYLRDPDHNLVELANPLY